MNREMKIASSNITMQLKTEDEIFTQESEETLTSVYIFTTGDSKVILIKNNEVWLLIQEGNACMSEQLMAAIKDHQIKTIAYVIFTQLCVNSLEEVQMLLSLVDVDQIFVPACGDTAKSYESFITVLANQQQHVSVPLQDISLELGSIKVNFCHTY